MPGSSYWMVLVRVGVLVGFPTQIQFNSTRQQNNREFHKINLEKELLIFSNKGKGSIEYDNPQ
jgi:hypothetical protein